MLRQLPALLCSIIQNVDFIQVNAFMVQNSYFKVFQSEIRSDHNTETALIKGQIGIYVSSDSSTI